MRWMRDALARLVSGRVRELERELDNERAKARLLERELRGQCERARADLEALLLQEAARLGAAHGCWAGDEVVSA